MLWALTVAAAITVQSQTQPPETPPKVPSDSFAVVTTGCLKGRVFTSVGRREAEAPVVGPDLVGRSFRVSGKKDVMKEVKANDGYLVEVNGLILKSAMVESVGGRVGNTRVVIGAPRDPMGSMRAPQGGLPVMDVTSLRLLEKSCPIPRK